jgi:PIN domain nuclease of toxin-antitoxin system
VLVLDTNVLIWLVTGDRRLSQKVRTRIERRGQNKCAMSVISIWELGYAIERRRAKLGMSFAVLRQHFLAGGIVELPLTGDMVFDALSLENLSPDPMDRLIVATARAHQATLITSDAKILDWQGELERLDAQS